MLHAPCYLINVINLLPQNEKEILLWERRQRMVILLGIIPLLFFFSFALSLFAGWFRVQGAADGEEFLLEAEKKAFELSRFKEVQAKADSYQKTLVSLSAFGKQATILNVLVESLAKAMPENIYLTSLSYNREKAEVQISGFAPTRTDLYRFKQNLEKEPFFQSVDFPAGNWIKAANINFQATLKIALP
jgi:Tfp pilus assembly protein PilN